MIQSSILLGEPNLGDLAVAAVAAQSGLTVPAQGQFAARGTMLTVWIAAHIKSLPGGMTGHGLHYALQTRLMELASKYGYTPIKEFPVWYLINGQRKLGHLDVTWFRRIQFLLACEIDSSFRKKSILKLLESDARHRIRIYYGPRPRTRVLAELRRYDPDGSIELVLLAKP